VIDTLFQNVFKMFYTN